MSFLNAEWSPERCFWGAGGGGGSGGVDDDDDDDADDVELNVLRCRVDVLGTGGWVGEVCVCVCGGGGGGGK